jgi:hypothetical protein
MSRLPFVGRPARPWLAAVGCAALAAACAVPSVAPGQKAAPERRIEVQPSGLSFGLWALEGNKKLRITYSATSGRGMVRCDGVAYALDVPDLKSAVPSLTVTLDAHYLDAQGERVKQPTDLAQVGYVVKNIDAEKAHAVEVRVLVDTLLEAEVNGQRQAYDLHPFVVPTKLGTITTCADLRSPATLPPYFKAITPTASPAEVFFPLRLGGDVVAPNRLVFTSLGTGWEVPVQEMRDSCFVLYWGPIDLAPKQERVFGFGCGLRLPR